MFGGQIALNHLHVSSQGNIILLNKQIDVPSSFIVNVSSVLHIHSYVDDKFFSKLLFKLGKYDKEYLNGTVNWRNKTLPMPSMIREYALRMALEGKFRTASEFASMFVKVTRNKL